MENMKKVGIMGGTFNPIHVGHLIMAEHAYEQFQLDQVLFMPAKNPPHKQNMDLISDQCRMEMVDLAIQDNPHFALSKLELERQGLTYTADTLRILKEQNPDVQYYFIIGADSFFQIETWREPEVIFSLSSILVAERYQLADTELQEQLSYLSNKYSSAIYLLNSPNIGISSNSIRNKRKEEQSIKYLTPDSVYDYIKQHNLYK